MKKANYVLLNFYKNYKAAYDLYSSLTL